MASQLDGGTGLSVTLAIPPLSRSSKSLGSSPATPWKDPLLEELDAALTAEENPGTARLRRDVVEWPTLSSWLNLSAPQTRPSHLTSLGNSLERLRKIEVAAGLSWGTGRKIPETNWPDLLLNDTFASALNTFDPSLTVATYHCAAGNFTFGWDEHYDYTEYYGIRRLIVPDKTPLVRDRLNSQKAVGVYALVTRRLRHLGGDTYLLSPPRELYFWPDRPAAERYPLFARPCPITPRHGFVDSRIVHNEAEAEAVYAEARAADPQAEMILMPPLTARHSGIMTGNAVSYGAGNDAATGGKEVVTVQTPGIPSDFLGWATKAHHGLSPLVQIKDHPYLEIVEHHGANVAVQLRDGPIPPTTRNYIPGGLLTYSDQQLIQDGGMDLLEWEKLTAQFKASGKRAIYWAPGSALSSHYAVHCILNEIPVITDSERPWHGQRFSDESAALDWYPDHLRMHGKFVNTARDANLFTKGLRQPGRWRFVKDLLMMAVATTHSQALWKSDHSNLQAIAAVTLARFIAGAAIGEARHFREYGPEQPGDWEDDIRDGRDDIQQVDWSAFKLRLSKIGPRNAVYGHVLSAPWDVLRKQVENSIKDFHHEWENSSYGGHAWGNVAILAARLMASIDGFRLIPTKDNWTTVQQDMNAALHAAHNSGNVFNKWLNDDTDGELDQIASLPVLGFASSWAAAAVLDPGRLLYEGHRYFGPKEEVVLGQSKSAWERWFWATNGAPDYMKQEQKASSTVSARMATNAMLISRDTFDSRTHDAIDRPRRNITKETAQNVEEKAPQPVVIDPEFLAYSGPVAAPRSAAVVPGGSD